MSQRNSVFRLWFSTKQLLLVFTLAALTPITQAGDKLEYNRDVRPILAENCFACHGPDSAARKAGLRLDRRDDAIKVEAIVPNKPEQSALIERIFSDDASHRMPPRKTKKTLTSAQKDALR